MSLSSGRQDTRRRNRGDGESARYKLNAGTVGRGAIANEHFGSLVVKDVAAGSLCLRRRSVDMLQCRSSSLGRLRQRTLINADADIDT